MKFNKRDIQLLLQKRMQELHAVREDGQKEYAHDDTRPFRNFETLAAELGIPREQVCWVYLRKHLDGILAHVKGHHSQREPVAGRFKDAHLYLYLLEFMLLEDATGDAERGSAHVAELGLKFLELFPEAEKQRVPLSSKTTQSFSEESLESPAFDTRRPMERP